MGMMGVKTLILFDIDLKRMKRLADEFQNQHGINIIMGSKESDIEMHLPDADLLINATPVGMHPKTDHSPVTRPDLIPPTATVFDMVYRPLKTKLIGQAESRGAHTLSGLRMLVAQACAADEIWLNRNLPEGLVETIWQTMKQQMETRQQDY
jgi:shikimate dehydrogenase